MGVVYRGVDTRLRRSVAIKALRPEVASNPARLARFEREAHLLAALNHPNIAAIHGLEYQGGQFWLVLEFVEGDTLAGIIAQGRLPVRRVVDVASQMAKAIRIIRASGENTTCWRLLNADSRSRSARSVRFITTPRPTRLSRNAWRRSRAWNIRTGSGACFRLEGRPKACCLVMRLLARARCRSIRQRRRAEPPGECVNRAMRRTWL